MDVLTFLIDIIFTWKVMRGLGLFVTVTACLIFNVFVLMPFYQRKIIKSSVSIIFSILAVVDLADLITRILFMVVSAVFEEWLTMYGLCQFEAYSGSFWNLMNMHVLCIFALERCIFIHSQSRHQEICIFRNVLILLSGILLFDAVIAFLPFIGWKVIDYFGNIWLCTHMCELSDPLMVCLFTMVYAIPLLIIITAYSAVFIRVVFLRIRAVPFGVLEENDEENGDSYSKQLKNQEMKTPKLELKHQSVVCTNRERTNNPKLMDENEVVVTHISNKNGTHKADSLSSNEFVLKRTFLLATLYYVLFWLPYVILTYIYIYSRYTPIAMYAFTISCWVSQHGVFVKMLIYVALYNMHTNAREKHSATIIVTRKFQEVYRNL